MTEEAKGNPTAEEGHFNYIAKVMKENEGFLRRNAEEDYGEIIDLTNDAIDLAGSAVEREDYVKYSTVFFLHNILMPSSYGIQTNLLTGNLPACFMQLRLMTESLAKCYLADLKYPDQTFFQEKLELLEKENISISKQLKKLGEKLGLKNEFYALWSKLSKDWMHTKGVVDRIVDQTIKKSQPPSWALVIPMTYAEVDLDTIKVLCKHVSQFRKLLGITSKNPVLKKHEEYNLANLRSLRITSG